MGQTPVFPLGFSFQSSTKSAKWYNTLLNTRQVRIPAVNNCNMLFMTAYIGKPRKKATMRPNRFTSKANKAAR